MKNLVPIVALGLASALLAGCASTLDARVQKLELGMSKDLVVRTLGTGHRTVGAREDSTNVRVEVLRFEDPKSGEVLVYLRDGKLVQWGDVTALQNMPQ